MIDNKLNSIPKVDMKVMTNAFNLIAETVENCKSTLEEHPERVIEFLDGIYLMTVAARGAYGSEVKELNV